jgi:hypothetical protein
MYVTVHKPSYALITSPLQTIRVVFRLLFVVPFFILAVDGLRPHQHINDVMYVKLMAVLRLLLIWYPFPT